MDCMQKLVYLFTNSSVLVALDDTHDERAGIQTRISKPKIFVYVLPQNADSSKQKAPPGIADALTHIGNIENGIRPQAFRHCTPAA